MVPMCSTYLVQCTSDIGVDQTNAIAGGLQKLRRLGRRHLPIVADSIEQLFAFGVLCNGLLQSMLELAHSCNQRTDLLLS
jgi:hypothetical protein